MILGSSRARPISRHRISKPPLRHEFPRSEAGGARRGRTSHVCRRVSPVSSCFFSVILPSRKLHKSMICLSYFQRRSHRHPCFYWKYPCFLFFSVLSTGSRPHENPREKPLLFLKKQGAPVPTARFSVAGETPSSSLPPLGRGRIIPCGTWKSSTLTSRTTWMPLHNTPWFMRFGRRVRFVGLSP